MPNWEGHKPATSAVLLDLLTTAQSGSMKFSWSERVLFTACEFWAAAQNRALEGLLTDDAQSQLQAAEQSFAAIGLTKAALILHGGLMKLAVDRPAPLHKVAANLENALANLDEPVDEALARFASTQTGDRLNHP